MGSSRLWSNRLRTPDFKQVNFPGGQKVAASMNMKPGSLINKYKKAMKKKAKKTKKKMKKGGKK